MIVVYPMIVSNAVSENTLPAIGKMLEQYILIYMQDDLLSFLNDTPIPGSPSLRYKVKGKKIVGESIDLNEVEDEDEKQPWGGPGRGKGPTPEEQQKRRDEEEQQKRRDEKEAYKEKDERDERERKQTQHDLDKEKIRSSKEKDRREKEKSRRDRQKSETDIERDQKRDAREEEKAERERDKEKTEKAQGAKVDVKIGSDRSISIEPTWMTVHTDRHGTQMIGIKVVPYRVHSDAKLSHLLMHDMKINRITALCIGIGRAIIGKLMRLVNKGPVSGDPKKDIIYRTTGHKGETFVILERNHDVDEYFLRSTGRINRLFKLGWGNFVIADDALQTAYFCMRASKGICQGMSYRMIYKTLGQSGVYEDLEDIRKQNASLFKMKAVRFSKLLGESKAENKLINYQERQ